MLHRTVKDWLLMSLSFSKPVLVLILEDVMASHFTFIRKHHLTLSGSVSYMTVTCQICDVFISLLPKETILREQAKTYQKMLKLTAEEGAVLFISLCSYIWFRCSLLYFYGMISTITAYMLVIILFITKYSPFIMSKISKYRLYTHALWGHLQKAPFKMWCFRIP